MNVATTETKKEAAVQEKTPKLSPEQEERIALEKLAEMQPVILEVCSQVRRKPLYEFDKRIFDIVAAAAAIVLLSPLMLVVAHKIRKESPGPAIFRQKRVGRNGKVFTMSKFRSMYQDAEARLDEVRALNKGKDGRMFKGEDDPRITPLGKKIRGNSIDELPQLFNILAGQMSVVGPRPPLPREVVLYEPDHTKRLAVKGGLTCFWQISPGRNDADFDFCYEQDMKYLSKRSWWTDLVLILRTVGYIFTHRGE